jgi:hypothetical protein
MTRGKVVIIQDFTGAIYGLLYGTFTTIEHWSYGTNWDQYSHWLAIKAFIPEVNSSGASRISFWTCSGGSFPYFGASGQSSPGNSAGLLATGLTTPGWSSSYPDFPRVACFIGICTIAFEGINILAHNYIMGNGYSYLGIIFIDFYGNQLIADFIALNNKLFGKCTATQKLQGCTCCSPAGLCLACNEPLNYVYNSIKKNCDAAEGYFLNSSFIPEPCSTAMAGCLKCLSETECTLCNNYLNYVLIGGECAAAPGYYLDSTSTPTKCNILGCYLCSSATVCTNCSSAYNFIMDPTGQCVCNANDSFTLYAPAEVCVCFQDMYLSSNGTCEAMPDCPANDSTCLTCNITEDSTPCTCLDG